MKSGVKRFRLLEIIAARVIRKRTIEEKVRSFALREDEAIWKAIDCQHRLQNSPYFCVFKYARAVKQKVWNEAENRERDWGETLKLRLKTFTPRFADFFTDFEKKTDCFAVYCQQGEAKRSYHGFVTVVISIIIIFLL